MSKLAIKPIEAPDRIINYWKNEKIIVLCILFFGLTFNISMILGPIYQGKLIDKIVSGESVRSVLIMALFYVGLILAIQVLRYFKRFYIRRFANSTSALMRLMIYNNIMHKSISDLEDESAGNLMTRTISDVDLCVEGMRKFTTEVFDTGVLMATYVVTLAIIDSRLTLISCLFIPIAMMIAEKLKKIIYIFSIEYRIKSSEIAEMTIDRVENAMMYRVNGVEGINRIAYNNALIDLQHKAVKALLLENAMQPIYNVIAMTGVISVLYLGGSKVILGEWRLGLFVTYLAMFTALAIKASKAAKLFNSVQKSKVSWIRIKPYLTHYQDKRIINTEMQKNTRLVVDQLSFRNSDGSETIFENLSFHANSGDIVGITGPVACGKSTLGQTLTGLYPFQGSIIIDGKPIEWYDDETRSKIIAYMGHEPQLLSDTIYNNITLGANIDISEVLKIVCMEEEVKAMKDGQNTMVGSGGVRLSGGQQARIALARTLLNKNKIIILDDPFSAVDMRTESKIIEHLKSKFCESIIFIISHRISIFKEISQIILMQSNKIVLYGTHEQLLQKSDVYAQIFALQYPEGGAEDDA